MAKFFPSSGFVLTGAVGGLVFCRRGNGVYARAHVIPRDAKTAAQLSQRAVFQAAVAAWKTLPDTEREVFRKRAARLGRTGYHLFLAEFLANNPAPAP
ncbi:MAG: HMG-box domain-containing protein [Minicystis sp.]